MPVYYCPNMVCARAKLRLRSEGLYVSEDGALRCRACHSAVLQANSGTGYLLYLTIGLLIALNASQFLASSPWLLIVCVVVGLAVFGRAVLRT